MRAALLLTAAILAAAAPVCARAASPAANAEMTRLYLADQADRAGTILAVDWSTVIRRDQQRRAATDTLLKAGKLHTAEDYEHAAFVFQHGVTSDEYLLAHTLAMIAVSKGRRQALWIASASLDRYLQAIGRSQIYGTQYDIPSGSQAASQGAYDRSLIPDVLRGELGVPLQAQQYERLERYRAEQVQQRKR